MQSAVVVLEKSTRFTFKANNAPVDIARHVVVQTDGGTLANWRIDIRTPTILNSLNYQLIYPARESQLPLKKYSKLVHFLLDSLNDRNFVFYNRESTLKALKLALPRDRSVDVGLHVLLRNDAFSRWHDLESIPVATGATERTRGADPSNARPRESDRSRQRYHAALQELRQVSRAADYCWCCSPHGHRYWRSRPGTELHHEDSLLLELESGASVQRRRREAEAALEIINELHRGSAPFHFVWRGAGGINKRRVEALNALLKLVPHANLALLNMLLEADLIERHAAREFIQLKKEASKRKQRRRSCGRLP